MWTPKNTFENQLRNHAVSFIIPFVIEFTRTDAHARWPAPRAISDEKSQPPHTGEGKIGNYRPSTRGNFRYLSRNVKATSITMWSESTVQKYSCETGIWL